MKPTVNDIITCLDKLIQSQDASSQEVYLATQSKNKPDFLTDFLKIPLSIDYPAWYYASLVVSNLLELKVDLRVYSVMVDNVSDLRVSDIGVLIPDPTETDVDTTTSLLSFNNGEIPWAFDWIITRPAGENPNYAVQINAIYRKSQVIKNRDIAIH
jgi:hypothetical protein